MKDKLEDFVRENRQEFDMIEPNASLWDGIDNKMNKSKTRGLKFYISRVAAVAAIFVVSFILQKQFILNDKHQQIPELVEAENYYSGLINAKLEEVSPMLTEFPGIKAELDSDLFELDSVYKSLRKDLNDNVANQEVIEAMIENYRIRIDILEEMMFFLGKQNEDNGKQNKLEYEL